jgi:hypothetical protein
MPTSISIAPPKVIDQHRVETLGGSAFSPVAPSGWVPKGILCQALAQNIRYVVSLGQAPTAAIGFQLVASSDPVFIPLGTNMAISFFREASGAILQYQWFGDEEQ